MSEDGSLSLGLGLPIVVLLLLANAVFVAAEFALVTVRRTRIDQLAEEGSRNAARVKAALGNLDYYIAAAQLGITMASILLGFVGEPVLARIIEPPVEVLVGSFAPALSHTLAIAVAFLFVTSLHIIVGEFIPKTIALEQPERASLGIAAPLSIFVRIFGPIIGVLNAVSNGLLRLLGMDLRPLGDETLTAEDLAHTFESSASAGLISRRELSLTRHLLHLGELEARELMVPRSQLVALRIDDTWDAAMDTFARHPLTRYPVCRDTLDDIVGILDAKRLLLDVNDPERERWQDHIHPATVLPDAVSADAALETMRRQQQAMVVLVDEYGGTAGIITQFDIVRYLAVDLPDQTHIAERHVLPGDDALPQEISGLVPVSEFRESAGVELPEMDSSTIGGLVTEVLTRIPTVGDAVIFEGLRFTVLEMDGYRVARVRVGRSGARRAAEGEPKAEVTR
jgi:CBS domain containing-hemolysin-like protein